MTLDEMGVKLRPAEESDVEFIVNSWLKSYRWNLHAKDIRDAEYFEGQKKVIVDCISDHGVTVACLEKSPTVVVAWACRSALLNAVLHFVYVKKEFRGYGLARYMVELIGAEIHVTHMTKSFRRWMQKHDCYRYNPYLLREL